MARIRSVHPSLFTDEAWVSCTPLARLLYIGLWTDADDQGLFEWKPLQIKMRLLPGDDADVPALLAELVDANLIAGLESGGKKLGAIRYFRKFQRPKKPNSTFVLPAEWANYVGLGAGDAEPAEGQEAVVPHQFPTEEEKSPQMEDGGGRRGNSVSDETGAEAPSDDKPDPLASLRGLESGAAAFRLGLKLLMDRGGFSEARARPLVGKWRKELSEDDEAMWRVFEAAWNIGTLDPQSYVVASIKRIQAEDAGLGFLAPSPERQRIWMQDYAAGGQWKAHERGPAPGQPGCRVSAEIQRQFERVAA